MNIDYKISFCTVSMNRLYHLKQTLPRNIEDNLDYKNIEFVVLDYNSSDNMEEWVKSEMKDYLESGILIYLRLEGPENFHRSHSRNVVFKNATGDIIVNLDADNYAGKGFAKYVNEQFNKEEGIFIIPEPIPSEKDAGQFGKVSVKKKDFMEIKGYDEQIAGYGFEDMDFYYRLRKHGLKDRYISDESFLECIEHGHLDRINNQKNYANLHLLYSRIADGGAEMIFLFKDNTFERATILYDTSKERMELMTSLKEKKMATGKWTFDKENYTLDDDSTSSVVQLKYDDNAKSLTYFDGELEKSFYEIVDEGIIVQGLLLAETAKNFHRYRSNRKKRLKIVNTEFGVADVKKN